MAARKAKKKDFELRGGGSVWLLEPVTPAAFRWIGERIPVDAQRMGDAVAVEHRFIGDIVRGIRDDGLAI